MKKEYVIYLLLFFACVGSRIWSAVYFPEDVESALYAHHIGHLYNQWKELFFSPLYIDGIKLLNALTESNLSYALVGGLATFVIIYASLRLANESILKWKGMLITLLIFFNPLLWLFANRYTPELTGTALLMLIVAMGLRKAKASDMFIFWLAVGLLPFVKWTYLLLAFPFIVMLCLQGKDGIKYIWGSAVGIAIVLGLVALMSGHEVSPLIPEQLADDVWLSSLQNFQQTLADVDAMSRAVLFFKTLWANAAGGWWSDRPLWLILPSLTVIFPIIYFLFNKTLFNSSINEYVVLTAGTVYAGVIFIFRDVETFAGDLLPLVPLFLIMTVLGIQFMVEEVQRNLYHVVIGIGLMLYALNTLTLVKQHMEGTTAQQIIVDAPQKHYSPLMLSGELLFVADYAKVRIVGRSVSMDELHRYRILYFVGDKKIPDFLTKDYIATPAKVYTHNAYVNPSSTSITLYKMEKR